MNDVARAQLECGQPQAAVSQCEEAIQWAIAKFGANHSLTDYARRNLAHAYQGAGRSRDARRLLMELVAQAEKETDDLLTADLKHTLACNLMDSEEWESAERLLRECLATRRRRQPKAWATWSTASRLGGVLLRRENLDEAEPLLLEGFQEMKAREGNIPPRSKHALSNAARRLGDLYTARGNSAEVERWRIEQNQYPSAKQPVSLSSG
jgi:hypothetical protein